MDDRHHLEIVGHRGAQGIAPENTLVSFQAALDAGVDMIELDVHLSSDGELVVIHDPDLTRTTDGRGAVGDLTLVELKQLNAAARFCGAHAFGRQAIPTLQEVYDLVAGATRINVEIKTSAGGRPYPGIEEQVIAAARRNQALDQTVISSFDFASLRKVGRLEPTLARYAIISGTYFSAMGSSERLAERVVADLVGHSFTQVAVKKDCLSQELMRLLRQAGFIVCAWIIDDVDEMWRYAGMGVHRVTTNRPDILAPAYRSAISGPAAFN